MNSSGKARAGSEPESRVAICLATYNPRIELFERQVDSIRGQTHTNWTCLVSDDRSDPESLERLRAVLGDDERFVLSRANEHLGFYRNFERALTLVPADASMVALCDQDDRWHPDKLEALVGALGGANLVYSDQRIVDAGGRVLSDSYWTHRRNNFTDLASLLVANTVTGAALLFRRELLDSALPFPRVPGEPYHDHWLALVALASGDIAYVDRPLYDYAQHDDAQLGHARANRAASRGEGAPPHRRRRPGWRAIYAHDYLRLRICAQELLDRCGNSISPAKRRALERFLAADGSPLAFGWLAARSLRPALGRNETLGVERGLACAIAWRRLERFFIP